MARGIDANCGSPLAANVYELASIEEPVPSAPTANFPSADPGAKNAEIDKLRRELEALREHPKVVTRTIAPTQSPSAPAQSQVPDSRHLTAVQIVRLKKVIATIPPSFEIRVESVAGDVEAMQYANEINEVVNEVRKTSDNQVIRGLSFPRIPQGVWICLQSETNMELVRSAQELAQEMIITGIPVLYETHKSFPGNRITILVGVRAIT